MVFRLLAIKIVIQAAPATPFTLASHRLRQLTNYFRGVMVQIIK